MVWNGTVKPQPHSSLTTTVLGGTRYCWRSRVIARGSAGWLGNQIRVAPSLLSALLHLLVPHLGPGHLKLHKEWFQPPPQITPIISNGGWEPVKGASGFHRSLGDPAQPAEFQFVRAPLHTHLHLLTTCPEGFSTGPSNHSPRSTSEPATTAGGCVSLVRGWHRTLPWSASWLLLSVGYAALSSLSASQRLSDLTGRVQVPPFLWSLPWHLTSAVSLFLLLKYPACSGSSVYLCLSV